MKDDQIVRIASGILATVAYLGRLAMHGNGPVQVLGFEPNSFVVICGVLVVLALPETIDMLPVGPTRSG